MVAETDDSRAFPRYEKDITMFIEVRATSELETDNDDRIVICNSLDLSATGAQVIIDENIPRGNIVRLCLQLSQNTQQHEPIFVVAKVVWQKFDDSLQAYHLGLNLLPSLGTDYQTWRYLVQEMSVSGKLEEAGLDDGDAIEVS